MLKDSIDTIDRLTVICFSPTRTSRKIAEAVAAGMTAARIRTIDLTLDRSDSPITVGAGETVVLGVPVYAGRVAPEAVRRLQRIKAAAGAVIPTVVTVTYGNRDYEDALVELYDLAVSLGLSPFAAGAFIGEHSYSTPEMPVAEGRTHWTWPMPVFSEENVPGNWTAPEHLPHFTSRATGLTKSRSARPQTHPIRHPEPQRTAARPNQLRLFRLLR